MKKNNAAFTLMELLLALSISGFIIIGMMQSFRNVQRILTRSRAVLLINKSVCLLFNQLERDFNTATIPTIAKIEKKEKNKKEEEDKEKKEEKPKEEKKPKDKKKKEEEDKTIYFLAESSGEEGQAKIDEKKYELFKKISFVNSNPLQVWGQQRGRLVRVLYELVQNKKRSTQDKIVYDLYRSETADLKNQEFKFEEEVVMIGKKQPEPITKHLVATNIKGMFVEYIMPKPPKKGETIQKLTSEEGKEELLELFSWGKTKETKNIVPEKIEILMILLDITTKRES